MVGKQLKHGLTLRASTILEVLISMIIIIVVFGIAMIIYTNVTQSSLSIKKIHAQAILNEQLLEAERTVNNINYDITIDSLSIKQEVTTYKDYSNLKEIHLAAYDINQVEIAELSKVIYIK
jgi:type II secretory pathway pseudopilin PulG